MIPGMILLAGVVGSTAYGLDTPDSDIDRLGVFAAPTVAFHGLHRPAESHVTTHPDATVEAAKWLRLALNCNPTVTELVWLERLRDQHAPRRGTDRDPLVAAVREGKRRLPQVRDSAVPRVLENDGDAAHSGRHPQRTGKHARHLWRLLHQGAELQPDRYPRSPAHPGPGPRLPCVR